MPQDPKLAADAALEAALTAVGAPADPRALYRPVLRHLKGRAPAAFARALAHFEETLVPAIAAGEDPLEAWLRYGQLLAELLGAGRTVEVDETGRARPAGDPTAATGLVLRLPEADDAPVLVLRGPGRPSPAQVATVELLVAGRVTASAYE
jgi:hypothetical protein